MISKACASDQRVSPAGSNFLLMGACQLAIVQYSAKLRGMSACQACSLHSRPVPLYGAQKLCGDIEWHFYTTDLPKALHAG